MAETDYKEGENLLITFSAHDGELAIGGMVHQVVTAEGGHKSYIMLLPVQVSAENLSPIVPAKALSETVLDLIKRVNALEASLIGAGLPLYALRED